MDNKKEEREKDTNLTLRIPPGHSARASGKRDVREVGERPDLVTLRSGEGGGGGFTAGSQTVRKRETQ